mmetsp:Transcript_28698/g.56383  ORF Transcript_28698/g.56383 Transcript_28698/m.56383 type:complete len:113 (+) Transcript_28698:26-364(+)
MGWLGQVYNWVSMSLALVIFVVSFHQVWLDWILYSPDALHRYVHLTTLVQVLLMSFAKALFDVLKVGGVWSCVRSALFDFGASNWFLQCCFYLSCELLFNCFAFPSILTSRC